MCSIATIIYIQDDVFYGICNWYLAAAPVITYSPDLPLSGSPQKRLQAAC